MEILKIVALNLNEAAHLKTMKNPLNKIWVNTYLGSHRDKKKKLRFCKFVMRKKYHKMLKTKVFIHPLNHICKYFPSDLRIGHCANTEFPIVHWKHKVSAEHLPTLQMIKVTGCSINTQLFHYIEVTTVWSKPTELKGSILLMAMLPFIKTEVLDKFSNKTQLSCCCVQIRNRL